MRGPQTGDGLHVSKEIGKHVLPVTEHIDNNATSILLAVVPGGALRRLPVALKDPVAEFAAHRENASEEAALNNALQLAQSGQEKLILHDTVLDACSVCQLCQLQCRGHIGSSWLFAINVLLCLDSCAQAVGAQRGCLRIEVEDGRA